MFEIINKFVQVETPIIKTAGFCKAYSPGRILVEVNVGEDENGDIGNLVQIISEEMVVTLVP